MTQAEWFACTDPEPMLEFLRGQVSKRKLRLFPVGCVRSVVPQAGPQLDAALDMIERFADGKVTEADVRSAYKMSFFLMGTVCNLDPYDYAVQAGIWYLKRLTVAVAILHDLFGNHFRPAPIEPSWLTWNDGAVIKLAQGVYQDRAFGRLPLIADALEGAGVTDADILDHCHQSGGHVRGCWVVDLLLKNE